MSVRVRACAITGAKRHDEESPGRGVRQHHPAQPSSPCAPPPPTPSAPPAPTHPPSAPPRRTPRRVRGLCLLELTSPGEAERKVRGAEPLVASPLAVTGEKLQPKLNTRLVMLTRHTYVRVCRHKSDTALCFWFFSLSGRAPSRTSPSSSTPGSFSSFTGTFQEPTFSRRSRKGKQEEDCMSPSFSLSSKEGKIYIYLASISRFFCLYRSIYLSSNYPTSFQDTVYHSNKPSCDRFCNYSKYIYMKKKMVLFICYNVCCLQRGESSVGGSNSCYTSPHLPVSLEGFFSGWPLWPWLRSSSGIHT